MTREATLRRIRGSAGLAATLATLGGFGFGASPAGAAPRVEISDCDGREHVVNLRDLEGREDASGSYNVGGVQREREGFEVETVLREPKDVFDGAEAEAVNYECRRFEASASGQSIVVLTRELTDSSFPDGPALFSIANGDGSFLLPGRRQGESGIELDGTIRVELSNEPVAEVDASASDPKPKPGDKVSFSSTVTGYEGAEVRWGIDSQIVEREAFAYRFKRPGPYTATATAYSENGTPIGVDKVYLDVGKLKKKGPDRRGGGGNRDDDAPESGARDGGRGDGGTGSGSGSGSGTGSGSGGSTASSGGATGADTAQQRAQEQAANGQRVVGELLSGPGTSAAAAEEAGEENSEPTEARTGFLREEEEEPFTIPGLAIGLAVLFALLAFGALGEYERLPRFVRVREKLKGAVAALPGVNG